MELQADEVGGGARREPYGGQFGKEGVYGWEAPRGFWREGFPLTDYFVTEFGETSQDGAEVGRGSDRGVFDV